MQAELPAWQRNQGGAHAHLSHPWCLASRTMQLYALACRAYCIVPKDYLVAVKPFSSVGRIKSQLLLADPGAALLGLLATLSARTYRITAA
jgi:hypothetical protein